MGKGDDVERISFEVWAVCSVLVVLAIAIYLAVTTNIEDSVREESYKKGYWDATVGEPYYRIKNGELEPTPYLKQQKEVANPWD